MILKGRTVNPGVVSGEALVSEEPLGFFGQVDPKTGTVREPGHPLEGRSVKGRILVFPCGKGSTVGSYVLYGLSKNGAAPLAIINQETEIIVAAGTILADIPCIDRIDILQIPDGATLTVDAERAEVTIHDR